jgi:hypothetical protein
MGMKLSDIGQRKRTPESEVVKSILHYLKIIGVMAWRNNTTGVYDPTRKLFRSFSGLKGVSDILGVMRGGRFLAIEAKAKDGRLSDDQAAFIDAVNKAGGLAFCARSIDDVRAAMEL